MREKRVRWGITLGNLLLGEDWLHFGQPLPGLALHWPALRRTRQEARTVARGLREKYASLRPAHKWDFRAVKVRITLRWGASPPKRLCSERKGV